MLRLSFLALRHPWITITLWLLLTALAVLALRGAKLDSDYRIFFDESNPQLRAFEELQAVYSKSDNLIILLSPNNGDVFTPDTLEALRALTEDSWAMPYASRAESLVNFQHTEAEDDTLIVSDLVPTGAELNSTALDRIRRIALNEPLLVNRLVSDRGHVAGVMVTFNFPEVNMQTEQPEAVAAARALKLHYKQRYPDMEIRLVGRIMLNNAIREAALYDMTHLVPLALLVALLLITLYMRHASGSLLTGTSATLGALAVIVTSVLLAEGLVIGFGMHLSSVTVNAPTMILTLAVADSLHILVSYFQYRRQGRNKPTAMQESLRINAEPVLLTSVTTIIGFLCLNFSDAPPFRDLGNTVAIGVAFAWVSAVTLLPACMMVLPSPVHHASEGEVQLMRRLSAWVVTHWTRVLALCTAVVIAALACLPMNELNDNWVGYFAERMKVRQDFDYAARNIIGVNTIEFSLSSGEEGGIADPQWLEVLDAFTDWLEAQPEITHVYSLSHTMKRLNRSMHGDEQSWHRLPDNRELAAQYLLLYELSLPYGLDLTNEINLDKSAVRVTAVFRESRTADQLTLQSRAQQWLSNNAPESMWHEGASTSMMFAHISRRNIISMLEGTLLGMLVIALIIAGVFRSVGYGVLTLFAIVLPVVVAFGLWGVTKGEVGIGLSIVAGVTLGIVVDYTVHFLSKYRRARQEMNLATEQCIGYAFGTVGIALLVTTAVLCANFGILGFSAFAMNAYMGILTAVTIFLALLAQITLMPALLMMLRRQVGR